MFQNSAAKEEDNDSSELKDSKPGASCNNESVDCSDIISNTSERDNATPKKYIETGWLSDGPDLITKTSL